MSVSKFSKFCACVLGLNFMLPFCNFPKVNAGNESSSAKIPNDVWYEGPFKCSTQNCEGGCLLKIELPDKNFYKNELPTIDHCTLDLFLYDKLSKELKRYVRAEKTVCHSMLSDYSMALLGNQVIDVLSKRPEWKEKITKIEIGEGIQWIGDRAFCAYYTKNKNNGETKKEGYINLKSVTLPNSLLGIGTYAFANSGVENITIPRSVRKISDYAFCNCQDLSKVKIEGEKEAPGSLEYIGRSAFNGCTSMLSLKLSYSVKVRDVKDPDKKITIDDKAFYNCSSLLKLDIPNTIQRVGRRAFGNCVSLEFVEVDEECELHVNQFNRVDVFEGCVNLLVDKSEPLHSALEVQCSIF